MNRIIFILLFLFVCVYGMAQPKTVVYHLQVSDTLVSYTGKTRKAIAINGQIPAPTLYFTEGDTAEIHVHNTLKNRDITTLAWVDFAQPHGRCTLPDYRTD